MKGLSLVFGLVMAFFVSVVQANIFQNAIHLAPKSIQTPQTTCKSESSYVNFEYKKYTGDLDVCINLVMTNFSYTPPYYYGNPSTPVTLTSCSYRGTQYALDYIDCTGTYMVWTQNSSTTGDGQYSEKTYNGMGLARGRVDSPITILGCPPDENLLYVYPYDENQDGEIDYCFNPIELDNASNCAAAANSGTILGSGNNTAPTVCKESLDGSRCAFSSVTTSSGATFYSPNLEQTCFGEDDFPNYDDSSQSDMPGDNQCKPYGSGFVCQASPDNYCDSQGVCMDGCGYVNDQFVCFRDEDCTGPSCSEPPLDCAENPDSPACQEQGATPTKDFCESNPTMLSCIDGSNFCAKFPTAASCQVSIGGGGGGGSFKFDYDRVINGIVDGLLGDAELPNFSDTQKDVDTKNDEYESALDEFMNNDLFTSMENKVSESVFGDVANLLPSGGSCTAFALGEHSLDLCAAAARVRPILYFVVAFLTFVYLRSLFFRTVVPASK